MVRLSANLGFLWPDRPLPERIDAAAAAGFEAVEFHYPYDVPAELVAERCRAGGVRALQVNTVMGDRARGEFGLAAIPGREAGFRAQFEQAASYARTIGAGAVHILAGITEGMDTGAAEDAYLENIRHAAAAAPDLTLMLEPMNRRDRPGYFCADVEHAADLVRRSGVGNLKILFDVYHVGLAQGDVLTRLRRHLPLIGHVQIAAVPSRAEPDEGEIAYRAVFAELERLGYDGWVGCEYIPRAGTDEGLAWRDILLG